MANNKKFVRDGIKLDGRNDILTLTDYFSVLLYYRVLKDPERQNSELPSIITKNDFSESVQYEILVKPMQLKFTTTPI